MQVAGALCMNHGALPHCPVESALERPQLLVPRQARYPHYLWVLWVLLLLTVANPLVPLWITQYRLPAGTVTWPHNEPWFGTGAMHHRPMPDE